MTESGKDPGSGRYIVGAVAIFGVAGIVGWGAMQTQTRADVTAAADGAAVDKRAPIALGELTDRCRAARAAADVAELERLQPRLAEAMNTATMQPKRLEAQLELAEALGTRAIEAAMRGSLLPQQRVAATRLVAGTVAEYEALSLDATDPTPRSRAASGRIALARGDAIEEAHAVALLPSHRDTELRLLAVAESVWRPGRGDAMSEGAMTELVQTLQAEPRRTGLLNLLLATALQQQGRADDALQVLDEILAEVPSQPTAKALRAKWTGAPVAVVVGAADSAGAVNDIRGQGVGDDLVINDDDGSEAPEPEPVAIKPELKPEPAAARPKPVAVEPEPEPEPAATKPTPKPEPSSIPEPPATKPSSTKPAPKPKSNRFNDLLTEGCSLAKGSNAESGLRMLQKAHDMQPGGTKVTLCMADAHRSLGRNASARAMCDRVLRKSPGHKKANLLMAKLEHERGNTAAAVRRYRKVLEGDPENTTAKSYVEKNG